MQKKLKLSLIIASLVMTAGFVFVACGSGEPIEVVTFIGEIEEADNRIMDWDISSMVEMSSSEEQQPESSSSESAKSSSSNQSGNSSGSGQSSNSTSSASNQSSSSVAKSSSSVAKSSSSKAPPKAGTCKENSPKSGVTCGWNVKSNLTPGTQIKPEISGANGCTVAFKYVDDDDEMTLEYGCEDIDENGIEAQGSKKYLLFANLDCGGTKSVNACEPKGGLSSKKAPGLKGTCVWDKNPIPSKRGATPSGVTIEDTDHVCGATTPTVKYRNKDDGKDWSTGELEPGTYDVEAYVNCSAYDVVPVSCPALTANAGSDYIIELDCAGVGKGGLSDCKGTNEAIVKVEECVDMTVINYEGDPRPAVVECNVNGSTDGSATVKLNGKSESITGYYGFLELGTFKIGENEFGTLCLVGSGSLSVKCSISKR